MSDPDEQRSCKAKFWIGDKRAARGGNEMSERNFSNILCGMGLGFGLLGLTNTILMVASANSPSPEMLPWPVLASLAGLWFLAGLTAAVLSIAWRE